MTTDTRTAVAPRALFAAGAGAIAITCVVILHSQLFARAPELGAWAVTLDLAVTIPALFYLVVIRTGHARPLALVPLFVICIAAASIIVPRGQQSFLHQLRFVAVPFELVTVGLILRSMIRMARSSRQRATETADPYERIQAATSEILGGRRLADVVALEITLLYYGLFSWRKRSERREDTFTVHERSDWGSVVAMIVVMIAAESLGMHLLVQLWSVKAAWVITAFDLYALLWLAGDYQALRLRPSTIREGILTLRFGLRWTLTTPLTNIAAVEPIDSESQYKRPRVLKVAMLDEPTLLVSFREPLVACGLLGLRRTVDAMAIRPDDAVAFRALLASS